MNRGQEASGGPRTVDRGAASKCFENGPVLRSGKKAHLDRAVKENLGRYKAHYINEMGLSRPIEVGRILMSSWETPLSKASLSWLGSEWRPSDILHLLLSLSTRGVLPPLGRRSSRVISEAMRLLRLDEAVLEQEAAEYQSTVPMCEGEEDREGSENEEWDSMVMRARGAVNKMGGVVNRARRMSYAAMEMAVDELMRGGGAARAAEFMVAFAGSREESFYQKSFYNDSFYQIRFEIADPRFVRITLAIRTP
ncbi:hypothetical protein QJS10_CPB11g00149 [Acorus calamus]|uniref:DOG1 domain-containing protein n=1 Tax=Acorus calamus TaxID=4465 RepID=A0AAV9DVL4_ACOCL|nr:hypothetical protein QJS10_CPB11g00149 [Acorus calamus]